ncbi:hypothetical protein RB653_008724 [Dictyostelium firmibasis]|uniref:Ergosterol biosynthetic protein 28 n=1 Tax=Dictyostelium firmibasis TaxID=79012 RepID=A0AAN7YRS1_9MYCE
MESLAIWLILVASYRFFMSTLVLFNYKLVMRLIYPLKPNEVTPLTSRIAYMWVLTNSILTFTTAFNMDNKPLYVITWLSFVIGLSHYVLEQIHFKTNSYANNASQLFFAGPCLILMAIRIYNW